MTRNSKVEFWRIVSSKYVSDAFSGKGAQITGGRFNSAGLKAVYTSGSLSLAMLELLVQVHDPELLMDRVCLSVLVDVEHVESIKINNLPIRWDSLPAETGSRQLGDKWLAEQRSLVLQVPSVVVPRESNFVINPLHPSFDQLEFGISEQARFDPRLFE